MGLVIPIILISISSYLLWRSCSNFDRFSKVIGVNLKDGVRGATINAIGSSLPEFFTTFFFLIILQDINGFIAGLSTVLGSAIFNILLIPSIVIIILIKNNHNLMINHKLIMRDAGILLVSQIFLLYFIQDGVITLLDSFYLFLIYIAYLLVLSRGGMFERKQDQEVHKDRRSHAWRKILKSVFLISIWCLLLVFSCEVLFSGSYPNFLSFLNFEGGLGYDNVLLVGLLFAAAASSVPDLFISSLDAKSGDTEDSLSNPIASNLFDICIAFGVPLFIYNIFNGEIKFTNYSENTSFQDIYTLIILMIVITILFLVSVLISKRYTLMHSFFFILVFAVFSFSIFNLDIIYNTLPAWI